MPHRRRSRGRRIWALLALAAALIASVGCRVEPSSSPAHDSPTTGVQDPPQEQETEGGKVIEIEALDRVPEDYDSRLTAILREPVPEDVIASFYYMAAGRSPYPNYRWELHGDGRLFVVYHSGKNLRFEVTFDQPLPTQPTKTLTSDELRALEAQLDRAGFFEQPALQRIEVEDGSYVILRARRGDTLHEVVYHNVEGPLVEYLYSITE